MTKASIPVLLCFVTSLALCTAASASEMVYHPVSPSFGGNPFNGSYLLQQAQAQGAGTQSGQQAPDLSGLTNSLNNLGSGSSGSGSSGPGSVIVINPIPSSP